MARPAPLRHWKSQTTTQTVCGEDPTPTASMALLWAADQVVLDVGAMPYAMTAHCVEANTTGLTERRFGVVIPPACKYARLHITRCGGNTSTSWQSDSTAGSTTSGGFSGSAVVTAPAPIYGDELYFNTGTTPAINVGFLVTSDYIEDAPGGTMNRALKVPEDLKPNVEDFNVTRCAGVGVQVFLRTANLEDL